MSKQEKFTDTKQGGPSSTPLKLPVEPTKQVEPLNKNNKAKK